MGPIIVLIRSILMIVVTMILIILEQITYIIPTQDGIAKYRYYIHLVIGRLMLFILGFYAIAQYGTDHKIKAGHILISNHSSWIDVLYFWTFYSPLFVSGSDGRFCIESPLEAVSRVIRIKVANGTESLDQVIRKAQTLKCPIVIFPEGSTTNGRALLKFNVFSDPVPTNTLLFGLMYSKSDFSPSYSVGSSFAHYYNLTSQLENKLVVKAAGYQNTGQDVNSNVLKGLSSLTRQKITKFTVKDKLDFNNFYMKKKK